MFKQEELNKLDSKQLQKLLTEERKKHYLLKVGVRTKHLKNTHDAKESQKNIARLLTELNKRQPSKQAESAVSVSDKS